MEKLTVTSTSKVSAECSDIVLRETNTTRLVFRPMLVENPKNPGAAVKGAFLFQRKGLKDEWKDFETIPLSGLKKDEGFKLEIKSAELLNLHNELRDLYQLHSDAGIPPGETQFVKANPQLARLAELPQDQIAEFLLANHAFGSTFLSRLLSWATEDDEPAALVERLLELAPDKLCKLNVAVGLQSLKTALANWQQNANSSDENLWQDTLTDHSFVLEQVFSWPTTIVKGKAYIGGKTITNTGGNIVDFLVRNRLTQNAALIEIKTPATPLLGRMYRNGIYNLSEDLSGTVMQILNYKHTLQQQYIALTAGHGDLFESFDPQCAVIIGNATTQLADEDQRKSFELFRNQIRGVLIITYDELFLKTEKLIEVLESPATVEPVRGDDDVDDIPF